MDITVDQKQISNAERAQISRQVNADLVDHLYRGCLPGTISGILASIVLFLDYYGYTSTRLLIAWIVLFNFMMVSLTLLYFFFLKYKESFSLITWEWLYSLMMVGCALSWVPAIYLIPADTTRQYLALIAVFLATTGYATGTIGQFKLCVATLLIILLPLIVWCFMKGGIFYNIIGAYSILYMSFMFGINQRSTRWFKDSLKLKIENTLVSHQANHDLLTGLPNQRLLPQYIDAAIKITHETDNIFALVCFSLNRMEVINDSLGHQAGNAIIQGVASRLESLAAKMSRKEEGAKYIVTISRKDTFNILITQLKSDDIDVKIRLLFDVLEDAFYLETRGIKMTASMGVSVYPRDGENAQALLINADSAMLQAKQFGGNRLEFYRKEINAQIPKQLELENDLHIALARHQFQVYYQPIVDVKTGEFCGMEALIRWPHPVHGFISPMHFVPLAEQTGLIVPIGEWVLHEACRQTQSWHEMGFDHLKVAVNLSEKQFRDEGILETIKRVLTITKLNPKFLELELTETAILDEKVIPIIKEFKALGVGLAVDDFGTGYSGLSYLKRFSIDKLKIDQSFIRDIPANNDSITIVSAILAMAKELKVKSLAEGVETGEQLNFLKEKKCDFIQGYYFSKPLDASLFTQLLLNRRNMLANTKSSGAGEIREDK